jgi:hypothetical protein
MKPMKPFIFITTKEEEPNVLFYWEHLHLNPFYEKDVRKEYRTADKVRDVIREFLQKDRTTLLILDTSHDEGRKLLSDVAKFYAVELPPNLFLSQLAGQPELREDYPFETQRCFGGIRPCTEDDLCFARWVNAGFKVTGKEMERIHRLPLFVCLDFIYRAADRKQPLTYSQGEIEEMIVDLVYQMGFVMQSPVFIDQNRIADEFYEKLSRHSLNDEEQFEFLLKRFVEIVCPFLLNGTLGSLAVRDLLTFLLQVWQYSLYRDVPCEYVPDVVDSSLIDLDVPSLLLLIRK